MTTAPDYIQYLAVPKRDSAEHNHQDQHQNPEQPQVILILQVIFKGATSRGESQVENLDVSILACSLNQRHKHVYTQKI